MKKLLLGIVIFISGFNIALGGGEINNNAGATSNSSEGTNSTTSSNNGGGGGPGCVELNTDFPGIDGRCVNPTDATDAFGGMLGGLMKLAVNITIAVSFIALVAAGIMVSMGGISQGTAGKGKELLKKVLLGIALLGLSGIILHTINPNFFKTGIDTILIKNNI